MKKILISTLAMMFTTIFIFAQPPLQGVDGPISTDDLTDLKRMYLETIRYSQLTGQNEEINGSSYILENFVTAKINHFKDVHLVRYNASTDDMEFKNGKDEIFVLNKSNDYTVTLNSSRKVYQTILHPNGKRGFAVLLWKSKDSNTSLFLRERIEFIPKKPAASSYSKDQPAEFKRLKDVLYLKDGAELIEIPTGKKKFFALFKDREKEVQQFAKKNKLKITDQEDIIKILDFYTS
ncbi:hypothetical protein GWK08_13390 [Leptobacterium flavescens]|uniref:GLPGLI family protein n=1 Tax=Leptobacterium flavescens TaxID=472055 RepID=A0A6P0UPL4_9FLAO|nr:hypothetical protein [Leptobacterium flavescens]NER14442.1 hypothetical protein [Leptobacterium flavescens]